MAITGVAPQSVTKPFKVMTDLLCAKAFCCLSCSNSKYDHLDCNLVDHFAQESTITFTHLIKSFPVAAVHYRGQLVAGSRQTSSNSEGGGGGGVVNRESSLDDSGVVDDHEDGQDFGAELLQAYHMDKLRNDMTPVTLALSPKEVRIIKCNGNVARLKKQKHNVFELHPEYLSQIVVLGGWLFSVVPW